MLRRFVHLLLIVTLCWQSLSFAGQTLGGGGALAHTVLHWQEAAHHHHDDGSVHEEDSAESRSHAMAEACSVLIFVAATGSTLPDSHTPVPSVADDAETPPPFLEGIRRPPRLGA
jgi:hypothetical protein